MQIHYSRKFSDNFGGGIKCSFTSIVTRAGKFGLFVDSPYFCYAGPHKYRRLPAIVSAKVLLLCAKGILVAKARKVAFALSNKWAALKATPSIILGNIRSRKERKEWDEFWKNLGQ